MNWLHAAIWVVFVGKDDTSIENCRAGRLGASVLGAVLVFTLGVTLLRAAPVRHEHPEYLIENWSAAEGVPENSALALAQTPDGYLWVGSSGGLFRFNAYEFDRASSEGLRELDTTVHSLAVDRSGRLWASTAAGLGVLEKGKWRRIGGTSWIARTVAENVDGEVFAGSTEGRLFRIQNDTATLVRDAPAFAPSGVFLVPDAKQQFLWVANRNFVGRWTTGGWKPAGPQRARPPLIAGPARAGGLWVYSGGQIWHHQADGRTTNWPAPSVDQPRELIEDSTGTIWITSMAVGLVRWRPGEAASFVTATNGLSHNAARCVFQDAEENLWVGTSSSGLFRFKPRRLVNAGADDGLTDYIVKTVLETHPGTLLAGTHGNGVARLDNDQVTWIPMTGGRGAYAWSLLQDRAGRIWTGTYGDGLLVEEEGQQRVLSLPQELGKSVGALLEDSRGRLWVGASFGLGVIENQTARVWPGSTEFSNAIVRSVVEDVRGGALWVGTFNLGVWRMDLRTPGRADRVEGLPRKRITSLAMDRDGCVWAGVFGEGLYCIHDGRTVAIGRPQGLPARTIGSFLDDGQGAFWLGSDRGILRVSSESLHRVVHGSASQAQFSVFDRADGMAIPECAEGFQPTALRDHAGRLWFATLRGVVRLDPATFRMNDRPAPVVIEQLIYADRFGTNHTVWPPVNGEVVVPAGSTDLEFHYAALSYAAPEKIQYAYALEGAGGFEVRAGTRRVAGFQALPPGRYRLVVRASNNDGLWNDRGASVAFTVLPFFWQTGWFRILAVTALTAGIGLGGWQVARARYRRQIERLEQAQALARERARLAAVMEATTDLVAFADHDGSVLHLNPAGRRLLGLAPEPEATTLKLRELFPGEAAERLTREAIPTAERQGTWQGESALLRRDGVQVPVSQVVMAHRDAAGQVGFISTIARDISEQKRAAEEKDRLQTQLAEAQKMESVGRLAGGVAHDFNNMLQVVLGHVELALTQARSGSDLEAGLLAIRRSAERCAELTRQLLAFGRRQTVVPRILDLNTAIAGTLKMLERLVGESIQITWTPGTSLWPVKIDPGQLDQILANLAVNARDAIAGAGTVTVSTANLRIEPGGERLPADCPPGDYVTVTVSDTGRGMPQEVLDHLFEPFFTTKAIGRGAGLGLATVFGIVKQNLGAITVQSQPNRGTTFRLFLPRAEGITQAPAAPGSPPPRSTETVLLVDDEPQILDLGRRALEHQGYRVLAASLPRTALELANQHPGRIDLLVTDMIMPGMTGKELRHHLLARHPEIRCLYMSGYTDDILEAHGGLASSETFLQKPFTLRDLADRVRKVLHG